MSSSSSQAPSSRGDSSWPHELNEQLFLIYSFVPERRSLFEARCVSRSWRQQIDATSENSALWRAQLVSLLSSRRADLASMLPKVPLHTTWRKAYQLTLGPTIGFGSMFRMERAIRQHELLEVLHWLVDLAELAAVALQISFSSVFTVTARGYTFAVVFKASNGKHEPGPSHPKQIVRQWWAQAVEDLAVRVDRRVGGGTPEAKRLACDSLALFVLRMSTIVLRKLEESDWTVDGVAAAVMAQLRERLGVRDDEGEAAQATVPHDVG